MRREALQADLQAATDRALTQDSELLYDVASAVGQIVGNVKHMHWFRVAVAQEIAARTPKYAPLRRAHGT